MAGEVFPQAEPRPTTSAAEKRVWAALREHLPAGWRAWHSLRLRTGSSWEGEGDFVVVAPDRGLLVLEVKGGRVELQDGRWTQNGRQMERSPRDQALGFARRLAEAVAERAGERWPPPYGAACAFPDVEFSAGPTSGDLDGLVLGARQLAWLAEALPALFERAVPDRPLPKSRRWLEVLHELWGETWVPSLCLSDRARAAEERVVALSAEQLRLLDVAADNARAIVTGSAGSGKTVVARELCVRRARRGERVLYLCFTEALAAEVARQLAAAGSDAGQVTARPIRRLASELLERAGHPVRLDDPEFWAAASLEAACSALPPEEERFDLVVVDEAQDLDESDWILVEELCGPRGLWIFLDDRQRYWSRRVVPERLGAGAATLRLLDQHRCPPPIWRFARLYDQDPGQPSRASEPAALRDDGSVRLVIADQARLLDRVTHELGELRRAGASPSDIAILTLAGQKSSPLLERSRLGSHDLARADDASAPASVIADTFLRFKGLERPFVILTELIPGSISKYDRRMHIACTRATAALIIVCTPAAVDADPRLARLAGREADSSKFSGV